MSMTKTQRRYLFLGLGIICVGFAILAVHYFHDEKQYDYTLYQVDGGWGYDITCKGKIIINQPFMPVVEGMRAFPDKVSARSAAIETINKFINGQSPMSVSKAQGLAFLVEYDYFCICNEV